MRSAVGIAWARLRAPEAAAAGVFVALVMGYAVWVAFALEGPFGPGVGYGPDSQVYVDASRAPVWSADFFAARGPLGFPLLVKLCAQNLRAVVVVQSLLYAAAWVFLAACVSALVRDRAVRLGAFVAVLATAVAAPLVQWNAFVTTESLSLTTLAVAVGLGLRVAAGARGRAVWAFAAALVAFGLVRDTNATVAAVVGVVVIGAAVVARSWRRVAAIVALPAVGVAALAGMSASAADPPRWFWPVTETIVLRYLHEPDAVEYLEARGMPIDDEVFELRDNYYLAHVPLEDGTRYRELRAWLEDDGRAAFVGFLVTHPWYTLSEPYHDRATLLTPDLLGYSDLYRNQPPAPYRWIGAVGFTSHTFAVEAWFVAAGVGIAIGAARRRLRVALVVAVATIVMLGIAGLYAAWHGDALEIDRHALTAGVQLRIGLWVAAAVVVDRVVRRARSDVEVAGESGDGEEQHHRARADEDDADPIGPRG